MLNLNTPAYKPAPHLTYRNGNPTTDMDLTGMIMPQTWGAIVAKVDSDKYGLAAPMLPLVCEQPDKCYSPWRYDKINDIWYCTEYLIMDCKVFFRRMVWPTWDVERHQKNLLAAEKVAIPEYRERMRRFRAIMRHRESIMRLHEAS